MDVRCDSNLALACRRPGLLLIGHGTRDARGVSEFLAVAELVQQGLPDVRVRSCFLELAAPSIGEAVASLTAADVDGLVVVPVLLFAAGHAKQDIPRALAAALGDHADIPYVLAPHLGTHERLVALSARRYREATAGLASMAADETLLLLVGRGSQDAGATAEMLEFSELRRRHGALPHVWTAFYAMAEPGLEATAEELRQRPFRRIVVQPHLLFSGRILDQIAALACRGDQKASGQEWVVCGHLGPAPELADVLIERFLQTATT